MKARIIGLLLHVANSSPPLLGREQFYAIKVRLLERYGRFVRNERQHIRKECWDCESGCYKCNRYGVGGGVWDEFWVRLELWELGGYRFHTPRERTRVRPADWYDGSAIEGYIEHRRFKYYLPFECALWLFLIYDRPTFWGVFGYSAQCSWKLTPLVWANTLYFYWRGRKWRLSKWRKRIADRLRPKGLTVLKIEEPDDIPF